MDGWLSVLLFAALFHVMTRFGCAAHTGHGDRRQAGNRGQMGKRWELARTL